ncbi:hypothetical protein PM10SUCC1_04940 [Propionigenium maris DSM 9537]|uniref:Uncharacterized protein n=1 Tax=Propionigenium maris DSM 9537 TaxID=1123000 RepID=A0A9W6LLQ6_9FUSO|nr:hypothetical protein [Propionigenium maris]GLI54979.1 hypothetical protein PM10SUCC1_04940 [Propionigenium maris DSM 9537]
MIVVAINKLRYEIGQRLERLEEEEKKIAIEVFESLSSLEKIFKKRLGRGKVY